MRIFEKKMDEKTLLKMVLQPVRVFKISWNRFLQIGVL